MIEPITPDKMLYINTPNGKVMVTVESDGSRWVSLEDYKKMTETPTNNKSLLQLVYSLAKQYVSWYDKEIKKAV